MSGVHDMERVFKLTKHFDVPALVIINKADLATALEISIDNMISDIRKIEPDIPVFQSNARNGEGLDDFVTYILNL